MTIKEQLGNTDIYIIDQILKGRYAKGDAILDAGCGGGRNLQWFVQNNFEIRGVDRSAKSIEDIKNKYPAIFKQFQIAELDDLPYSDNRFDHVICSAVLHFAENQEHFKSMFSELVRVLKPAGSLFVRLASNFGIKEPFSHLKNGVYLLNDKTNRFLLTSDMLNELMKVHQLQFLEKLKTTNVNNLRCMTTLVLMK